MALYPKYNALNRKLLFQFSICKLMLMKDITGCIPQKHSHVSVSKHVPQLTPNPLLGKDPDLSQFSSMHCFPKKGNFRSMNQTGIMAQSNRYLIKEACHCTNMKITRESQMIYSNKSSTHLITQWSCLLEAAKSLQKALTIHPGLNSALKRVVRRKFRSQTYAANKRCFY